MPVTRNIMGQKVHAARWAEWGGCVFLLMFLLMTYDLDTSDSCAPAPSRAQRRPRLPRLLVPVPAAAAATEGCAHVRTVRVGCPCACSFPSPRAQRMGCGGSPRASEWVQQSNKWCIEPRAAQQAARVLSEFR